MRHLLRHLRWLVPLALVLAAASAAWFWWSYERRSARFAVQVAARDPRDLGPRVVRGPYLQMQTPHSVVVRWRTDLPVRGRVAWGQGKGARVRTEVSAPSLEHEHLLTNLLPQTEYTYAIGLDDVEVQGAPNAWTFTTHPAPGTAAALRIWVLGDSGTASPGARAVRDAFFTWSGGRRPQVWLMLGDNAYNTGTDLEYQGAVFEMYPALLARLSLWPTRGNHDRTQANGSTPYLDVFTMPRAGEGGGVASGSESFFSFDYGDVHFINLDSFGSDRSPGGAMATWLKADLAASASRWRIAYFHHPPYTRGTHDSDRETYMVEMRRNIVPLLEQGDVDLVLSGHSHNYERSGLIAGHHGASATFTPRHVVAAGGPGAVFRKPRGGRGTVYVVAGASGELGRRYAGLDHPVMQVSSATLGSLVIDVTPQRMNVVYLTSEALELDRFALEKL